MGRERIYAAINAERDHQDEKWGEQNHIDLEWLAILTEEVGEVARCNCHTSLGGKLSGAHEQHWEQSTDDELVQVAAVALAWLECRARRREQS